MTTLKLRRWKSEIETLRNLANQSIIVQNNMLVYSIEDLDFRQRHEYTFQEVLGFRYQTSFALQRLYNTFVVDPSEWILSMSDEPYRIKPISSAVHYLFDNMDGQFEVVAMEPPSYKCINN